MENASQLRCGHHVPDDADCGHGDPDHRSRLPKLVVPAITTGGVQAPYRVSTRFGDPGVRFVWTEDLGGRSRSQERKGQA